MEQRDAASLGALAATHARRRAPRSDPASPVSPAVRTHVWRVWLACAALLWLGLAMLASHTRDTLEARQGLARAHGALPAGPETGSIFRSLALQGMGFSLRYLRVPSLGPGETVVWSADGRSLVTGSGDGTIARWRASDGRLLWAINPLRRPMSSLTISADGARIVCGAAGGAVLWIDARTARVTRRLPAARYMAPAVAFAPSGIGLAVASGRGDLALWAGTRRRWAVTLGRATTAVGWSPDGRAIAIGTVGGALELRDAASGGLLARRASGHEGTLWSLAWSPLGGRLAVGWADGTVRVLAGSRLTPVLTLKAGGPVNTLGWSAEGSLLSVTAVGRPVQTWEARTGLPLARIRTGWDTNQLAWSPDGRSLATVDDGHDLRLWRVAGPQQWAGRLICALQARACRPVGGTGSARTAYMGR